MEFVKSLESICSVDSLSLTIPTTFIVQQKEEVMRVAQAEWDLATGQIIEESKRLKTSRQFDTKTFTLSIRYTPNRYHIDERGTMSQGPCYMIGLSSKLLKSRYREGLHEGSIQLALETFQEITQLEFFNLPEVIKYGLVSDLDVKYDSVKENWFTVGSKEDSKEDLETPLHLRMVDHEEYFNNLWKLSRNVQHAKPYIKDKHSKAIRYWSKFRRNQSSLKQPFAIWYSKLHEYSNPNKEDFRRFVDTHLSPEDWMKLLNTVRYETTLYKAKDVRSRFGDNKLESVMLPLNDNRYFEVVGKSLIYNMDTDYKRTKSVEMKRVDYSILLLKRDVESRLHSSPLWKDGVSSSSLIKSTCKEIRQEHQLLFERDLGRDLTEQEKATLRSKFKFIQQSILDEVSHRKFINSAFEAMMGMDDFKRMGLNSKTTTK